MRSFLITLLLLTSVCAGAEPKLTAKGVEFFESKIRPVLAQRCYSCHSATAKEVKGELLLDTREGIRKGGESGAAVVPGDVADSLLIQAIKHETYEMPPGDKLPEDVIADFEKWIEMGAPDPRSKSDAGRKRSLSEARQFWSFHPVRKPNVPEITSTWPADDLDRFVYAKLQEQGLTPVRDADAYALLRRINFDLTGLPPTLEEIEAFVNDPSTNAFEKVVDRLLDSPRFGERWGRHWLDAARYGDSTGKERNIPYPYAWRYRNYVIDAFNHDKPYSRFIMEQLAGDLLPAKSTEDRNENLVATGFLAIGTKSLNERKPPQFRADVADEQIDVVTRSMLGVTIACARCHDHKFDPFPQTDYYALAGIFKSTEVLAGVQPGNNKSGYQGELAYLAPPDDAAHPKRTPEELEKIDDLKSQIAELRSRIARGQQFVQRPGKPKQEERVTKLLERGKQRLKVLNEQLASLQAGQPKPNEPVMAVRDARDPRNAAVNERGEVNKLGAVVPRGIPVVLALGRSPRFETNQSGRMQLAAWIASKENPLTARVMVNRVWSHLFGRGIVESVDNFGALGDAPSHPQLLDHLATRFVEQGWSVKKLIREIVLSRTYRLSSEHHEGNYAIDGDNRYLWRSSRRRLESESIRDAILAASGMLDLERPEGSLMKLSSMGMNRGRLAGQLGLESKKRSVYLPLVRGATPEALAVFDQADPSLSVSQREVTTVATQALFLMNSPVVIENCQALAKRLMEESSDDQARIERLFLLVLNRPPTEDETSFSARYLQQYAELTSDDASAVWASLAQTLFATGEFRFVY